MEADAESLGSKAAGAATSKRNNMRAPATPSQVLDSDVADMKNVLVLLFKFGCIMSIIAISLSCNFIL